MSDIYSILSSLLKYIFITIIYLFIFGIMRMIFLDIRKMDKAHKRKNVPKGVSYLELITEKNNLYFDVKSIYQLDKDVIIIGRGSDCNIKIDDLYMSTHQTQLWQEENEWYISDMGSTNGTYVNGTKMDDEPLILDSGDKLRIGQVEFLVVIV